MFRETVKEFEDAFSAHFEKQLFNGTKVCVDIEEYSEYSESFTLYEIRTYKDGEWDRELVRKYAGDKDVGYDCTFLYKDVLNSVPKYHLFDYEIDDIPRSGMKKVVHRWRTEWIPENKYKCLTPVSDTPACSWS